MTQHQFQKGSLSGKSRNAVWEIGLKIYNPSTDRYIECNCSGHSNVIAHGKSDCLGKRVPHVFFACPYCKTINGEHRNRGEIGGYRLSVNCSSCGRHLWITFRGLTDEDWDEALIKKEES